MHVRLLEQSVRADSRLVAGGSAPHCVEIDFEVRFDRPPSSVWLSFYEAAERDTETFANRNMRILGDVVLFTCRGDEVEVAFDALKTVVMKANSAFYGDAATGARGSRQDDEESKRSRDREFVERARALLTSGS